MKKRVVTLTFAWMLAVLLAAGCGNTEAPTEEVTVETGEAAESEETAEEEPTEEAAPEEEEPAAEEPAGEETAAEQTAGEEPAEEESMPEEEEEPAEIPPVPETDEWAANLYNALLADDYKTVMELAPDPATVHEHCDPYVDAGWSWWDYESAYRMVMSDGQVMGVILYENEDDSWEIDSFVSYQEGDGFEYTGYGDHQVTLYSDGGYSYIRNGNEVVSESDYESGFTMENEDEVYAIWHM